MKTNIKEREMRMKIGGIFAAFATVLVITVLLIGCLDPLGPSGIPGIPKDSPKDPPPPGKVYLRINVNDTNARTLIPTLVPITHYEVVLEDTATVGKEPDKKQVFESTSGNNLTATLTAGKSYNLTVLGYDDDPATDGIVVAAGEHNGAIAANAIPSGGVTVDLGIVDDEGIGFFAWNITSLSTAAEFRIAGLSNATNKTINLTTATPNSDSPDELSSGYYRITLFINGGSTHFDLMLEETVHIYRGQTTNWVQNTIPAMAPRLHTVTLDADSLGTEETAGDHDPIEDISHGDVISPLPTAPEPISTWHVFDGWYTEQNGAVKPIDSFLGTKWTTNRRVLGSFTLYAGYVDNTPEALSFTFGDTGYQSPTDLIGVLGEINNVYYDDLEDLNSSQTYPIEVKITGKQIANFDTLEFWIGSNQVIVGINITDAINIEDNNSDILITINFRHTAFVPLLNLGHIGQLIVRATTDDAGNTLYWGGIINVELQAGSAPP